MNAKPILAVFLFLALPTVSSAAQVKHFSSSGAFGSVDAYASDECSVYDINIYAAESPDVAQPSSSSASNGNDRGSNPALSVMVFESNNCTRESHFWFNQTNIFAFSHTPSSHNTFPDKVSMSGDVILTESLTGLTKNIHVDFQLSRTGDDFERSYSDARKYLLKPSSDKVDINIRHTQHEGLANGSLNITGDIQCINGIMRAVVGVSSFRELNILH